MSAYAASVEFTFFVSSRLNSHFSSSRNTLLCGREDAWNERLPNTGRMLIQCTSAAKNKQRRLWLEFCSRQQILHKIVKIATQVTHSLANYRDSLFEFPNPSLSMHFPKSLIILYMLYTFVCKLVQWCIVCFFSSQKNNNHSSKWNIPITKKSSKFSLNKYYIYKIAAVFKYEIRNKSVFCTKQNNLDFKKSQHIYFSFLFNPKTKNLTEALIIKVLFEYLPSVGM